jgi:hypothetical protein
LRIGCNKRAVVLWLGLKDWRKARSFLFGWEVMFNIFFFKTREIGVAWRCTIGVRVGGCSQEEEVRRRVTQET